MRNRENPAVALLMGPVPACRLGCVSGRALAWGEWSPPALSMAAGRGGSPIKWGAVSPAEAIRAEPATVGETISVAFSPRTCPMAKLFVM